MHPYYVASPDNDPNNSINYYHDPNNNGINHTLNCGAGEAANGGLGVHQPIDPSTVRLVRQTPGMNGLVSTNGILTSNDLNAIINHQSSVAPMNVTGGGPAGLVVGSMNPSSGHITPEAGLAGMMVANMEQSSGGPMNSGGMVSDIDHHSTGNMVVSPHNSVGLMEQSSDIMNGPPPGTMLSTQSIDTLPGIVSNNGIVTNDGLVGGVGSPQQQQRQQVLVVNHQAHHGTDLVNSSMSMMESNGVSIGNDNGLLSNHTLSEDHTMSAVSSIEQAQSQEMNTHVTQPTGVPLNDRLDRAHTIAQLPYAAQSVFVQFIMDPGDATLAKKPFQSLTTEASSLVQHRGYNLYEVNAQMKLSNLGIYCGTRLMMDSPVFFSVAGLLCLSKLYWAGNDKKGDGSPYLTRREVNNNSSTPHIPQLNQYGMTEEEEQRVNNNNYIGHICDKKPPVTSLMVGLQNHTSPLDPYMSIGDVVQELLSFGSLTPLESRLAKTTDVEVIGVRLPIELGQRRDVPLVLNVRRSPFCTIGLLPQIVSQLPPMAPASVHISTSLAKLSKDVQDAHGLTSGKR